MRIAIYGAGAVGGHLAARLAASGNDVSVVARGPNLEALRTRGAKLLHGEETIAGKVRASERPGDLGTQDMVIVTLKANALSAVAQDLSPLLDKDTAVVFAQNGIPWWYGIGLSAERRKTLPDLSRLDPGGVLARAVAPERILGAVIYSANDLVEPGVVRNHTPGNNMLPLGEADDRASKRVLEIRKVLEASGMASPATSDIREVLWNKAVTNLGTSTVSVLTEAALGAMRADPGVRELLARLAAEGRAIAAAHGIQAQNAPPRPGGGHSSGNIAHKTSMLQDYERGRPMEIEAQLMAPLAFARAGAVQTPALDALVPVAAFKAAARGLYQSVPRSG